MLLEPTVAVITPKLLNQPFEEKEGKQGVRADVPRSGEVATSCQQQPVLTCWGCVLLPRPPPKHGSEIVS